MSIRIPPRSDIEIQNAFRDVEREINATNRLLAQLRQTQPPPAAAPERENRLPDDRKVFVPAGPMHAVGLVPDPGSTAGGARFLQDNGEWTVPVGTGSTATDITYTPSGDLVAGNVQDALDELESEKVARAGDIMTGSLAIGETAGETRHAELQVVTEGVGGVANVRIANEKIAAVDETFDFWRTPLTIWNNFGSAAEANNSGVTGVNTGLRVIAGTNNPSAAAGTPGADSIVGTTLFSANGDITDPKNLWGINNLVHYFRSPNADPASGLYIYGIENEVIHNTATDHVSDPFVAITANNTRSLGLMCISHTDNPKKLSAAIMVDAGGYTLGSGGRAGTNWWKTGLALTRCSEQGILFDVRADEIGTAFATAGIYFKGIPAGSNLIRSDIANNGVYLPFAGDVNFNFYNSAEQNLYVGIGAGDGSPTKTCGLKLYDFSTLKWSLLKDTSNKLVIYDNVTGAAAATFTANTGIELGTPATPVHITAGSPTSTAPTLYVYALPIAAKFRANTAASSIPVWDTTTHDSSGGKIVTQSSNSQIKVTEAGYYHVSATVGLSINASTQSVVTLYRYNSGAAMQEQTNFEIANRDTAGAQYISACISETYLCAANDYFVLTWSSGSIAANDIRNQFSIERLN